MPAIDKNSIVVVNRNNVQVYIFNGYLSIMTLKINFTHSLYILKCTLTN